MCWSTGGGVGFQAGVKAGVDFSDDDMHQATNSSRASHDARHDMDAKATRDFKEAVITLLAVKSVNLGAIRTIMRLPEQINFRHR